MAKKITLKFNKTTLLILIVVAVILALVVALAFSPLAQGLIDGINQNADDLSNQNNGYGVPQVVQLGGNLSSANSTVILENVTCKVHFINVGQGDAILCQFSDGVNVLIDAGSGSTQYPSKEIKDSYLEYLFAVGVTDTIDYLIATHPDTDHYNIFPYVLDSYSVTNIMYNDVVKGTESYENFKAKANDEVANASNLRKIDADGEFYDNYISGNGYEIDVYAPGYSTFQDDDPAFDSEESNGMSPIILLTVSSRKILLTGDATFETENWFINELGESALDIDVLKVGHHGAAGSTSEEFLQEISAEYAIISSDEGGAYAHPRPELMTRLFNAGVVTYRTSRHGSIILNVDESGDFAFQVENEVMVENNTKGINDKMLITQSAD